MDLDPDAEASIETQYLLRSEANAARLLRSIEDANAGRLIPFDPTSDTIAPAEPSG